jgi:hypothetical protein
MCKERKRIRNRLQKPVRTGELAIAVCEKHNMRMYVGRTVNIMHNGIIKRVVRYCYCHAPGCDESKKVISS